MWLRTVNIYVLRWNPPFQNSEITLPRGLLEAFIAAMIPTAEATPTSAIKLCPHACPISGSASNSLITQMLGFDSEPKVPLKAVSSLYDSST